MLFQKNILRKYLALLPAERTDAAWSTFQSYFLNADIQQNILQSKEEQFQEGFLRELFVKVLGYTLNPSPDFNLITEQKNETNSKKADGAILLDGKVVGVIELKDHKTPDLTKVETQAFGYKNQHPDARLVIISNFEKLRLYIDNTIEHREWNLFTLSEHEFRELYLCLAFEQVKQETALKMKQESVSSEDQITKALYKDYSQFKRVLFADIVKNNPDYDQLLLFKKTQKLLDRLLFIFFAEDCLLLPPNSMIQIIDQWEQLSELDAYVPFYDRIKKYFGYMNTGFHGKKHEIFAYNGGLFKPDEVLDNIIISDEPLVEHTKRLSAYDFESEVDVNILGHIFENSLSEIEEITQSITRGQAPLPPAQQTPPQAETARGLAPLSIPEQQTSPQAKTARGLAPLSMPDVTTTISKRKQDGVFYTPQYITKYIVEQTVGRLCTEKKQELGIDEAEYFRDAHRQLQTRRRLDNQLTQYREWLMGITILDPACGSGAFLNAAFKFLKNEHEKVFEMMKKITGYELPLDQIDNEILEHNLFGVDINEESVEIAQLALWLRTAKPRRKLNTLSDNIKCGNSLISPNKDDNADKGASPLAMGTAVETSSEDSKGACPLVNFPKAFDWQKEFPQIFRMKRKKAWHIVTATHDSRTSQRMIEHKVREKRYDGTMPDASPVILSEEEELLVCQVIDTIIEEDRLNVIAFNICQDHFHMLLVCEDEEVDMIVGKIKSLTAIAVNKHRDASTATGQASPSSRAIWTQKYSCKAVTEHEHFNEVIDYIERNRIKHDLPPLPSRQDSKGACPLVHTISFDEAFRDEYEGGFDIVIGNPPYVRADSPGNSPDFRNYMTSCGRWETLAGKWDLYIPFLELGTKLAKPNGLCSFIIPDAYCHAEYSKRSLEYMKSHRYLSMIDYFPDIEVFENVGVKSIIVTLDKHGADHFTQRIHDAGHNYIEKVQSDYPDSLRIDAKQSIIENKEEMIPLESICYMTVGIVGNSDEKQYKGEFLVGDLLSDVKDDEHPKLYYEGKDIGSMTRGQAPLLRRRYIEYGTERSPMKWRRKGFTEMFEGSPKLVTMRSPGTFPRTFLDTENGYFNESAIGFKRWCDLRGIDNSSIAKALASAKTARGLAPLSNISDRSQQEDLSELYPYKVLLAIFNSSLIRYELNTERRSNIHIYPDDWKRIKLPLLTKEQETRGQAPLLTALQSSHQAKIARGQAPLLTALQSSHQVKIARGLAPLLQDLEILADKMLSLNKELQEKRTRFLRRLTENFEGLKITTALQTFDQTDFKTFVAELKKQKIRLSLVQQDEWEDYFCQYAEACANLSQQISETNTEIDNRVFDLYGLTPEERQTVLNT